MDKKKIKNSILIIGGTGFIGYHLAEKCLQLGWSVTIFSINKPKNYRKLKGAKYHRGNIFVKSSLKKINKYFDFVVNLGGYVDHVNRVKNYKIHFIGCKNLVKIFLNKKIKLFLQIGSGAEYGNVKVPHKEKIIGNPQSTYGRPKYLATNFLIKQFKKYKFPCSIVRLYQVFGKKQDPNRIIPFIIQSCLRNQSFPCSDGKQLRDFIHVEDVVNAILKSLKSSKAKGEIINIGTGKPQKIKDVINFLVKRLEGGKPNFGKIKLRKDEISKIYPDISKAKKILKWTPKIKFKKGLEDTIRSYEKK